MPGTEDSSTVKMVKSVELGMIVVTVNAKQVLPSEDVFRALNRHANGDWGELPVEDWDTNELALQSDGRLLSSYRSNDGTKFWIITEWDRSVTTVLLPQDY